MSSSRTVVRKPIVRNQADCHILLVEDQQSLATMTAGMLTDRWGFNVTIASTYKEAQDILEKDASQFFITVSDLNLPDAPNGEIIDLLNSHKQSIIAITGFFDQNAHDELRKKGIIDYVLKQNINAYEYLVQLIGRLYFNQFIKVIVIDDSESIREMTRTFLKKQFLKVVGAANGEEGLALLKKHPDVKLILVDAEMPVMDGLTFTAQARQFKNQNELCIIGISSTSVTNLSAKFLKHGANDFISKPFSYDELTCRVNQNLNMLCYIEEIYNVAHVDFLTKLPNRRDFFSQGETAIKKAIATSNHALVGIIDIDHFKRVNDTHGHDCGDAVLNQIGETIQKTLENQICARIGGEEFGFIISLPTAAESDQLLNTLIENIRAKKISHQDKILSVTVSIGATDTLSTNLDETLKIADNNLYQAKTSGRNKVIWHQQDALKAG
jgi:diguanylate cyclase (GGDEF)-like protein